MANTKRFWQKQLWLTLLAGMLGMLLAAGGAGAQTITQDNFAGTAGTALTSHSAQVPASPWTSNAAFASTMVLDGSGDTYSSATADGIAVAPGAETSQVYYVRATLHYTGSPAAGYALGIAVQQSASTLQNYQFTYSAPVGSPAAWVFQKHSSGGPITTGLSGTTSSNVSLTPGTYPVLVAVSYSGGTATFRCYVTNMGAPLLTVTDTSPWSGNGLVGIESYGAGTAANNVSLSSFSATNGPYAVPSVYCDGDSVVQGVNGVSSYAQQYQSLLSSTYGVTASVTDVGVAGQNSYQALWGASGSPASPGTDGLDQQILANHPDIVTFEACLLNDFSWVATNGTAAYQSVLRTYINKCLAQTGPSGRPTQLLLLCDNYGGTLSAVRPATVQDSTHLAAMQVFNEYANNPNVLIFDTYKFPRSLGVDSAALYAALQPDHNHPTAGLYGSFLGATLQPLANLCVTVGTALDATVNSPLPVLSTPGAKPLRRIN